MAQRGARAPPPPRPPHCVVCRCVVALRRAHFCPLICALCCAGRVTHSCLRPPVLRRRSSGPQRCAFQWRNPAPALPTAASACATTCAITRCACLVARRAQRRTRHALRYECLPFERARSRLRPPMLAVECSLTLLLAGFGLAARPSRSIRTPHNTPLTSLHVLIVQVGATRRGWRMCEGCWGRHRAAQWPLEAQFGPLTAHLSRRMLSVRSR